MAPEVPYFRRAVERPTQWPGTDARPEPFARAVNEHLGKVLVGLAALDLAAAHARIDAAARHGMGNIHAATRAASAAEAAFDDTRHLRDLNRNTVTGLDQVHGYQDAVDLAGHVGGKAALEIVRLVTTVTGKAAGRAGRDGKALDGLVDAANRLAKVSDRIEVYANQGEPRQRAVLDALAEESADTLSDSALKALRDFLRRLPGRGGPTGPRTPP